MMRWASVTIVLTTSAAWARKVLNLREGKIVRVRNAIHERLET